MTLDEHVLLKLSEGMSWHEGEKEIRTLMGGRQADIYRSGTFTGGRTHERGKIARSQVGNCCFEAIKMSSSTAARVEAVVIGAGVVGLAIARALAMRGKEVMIIERAGRIGSG